MSNFNSDILKLYEGGVVGPCWTRRAPRGDREYVTCKEAQNARAVKYAETQLSGALPSSPRRRPTDIELPPSPPPSPRLGPTDIPLPRSPKRRRRPRRRDDNPFSRLRSNVQLR